ncbi:hypothetical protein [Aliivibrio salmonicida]|uniref:hypothetical protein n=1 Tax=Aliivibrio salmonicida TaxID=40269 RepID=UPI003D113232
MDEVKFSNLCSHYKDSFDIHRSTIKHRDTLFYGLLVILAVFTLQLSSADTVANIVNEYVNKISGVKIGNNVDFISTLMWLLLLGFSTRYFQVVLEIERQYGYLHQLEELLNDYYPDTKVFTREGKSYLSKYPLFSNWVWLLYTLFFPSLMLASVIAKIRGEVGINGFLGFNQIIDFTCYLIIGTSSILYTYRLHESGIHNVIDRIKHSTSQ